MTTHVISFSPTGEAQAMHNDKFDLSFLGRQSIERATEIKFFGVTQTWTITFPDDDGRHYRWTKECEGFPTYEGARKIEVAWLNECRAAGLEPMSKGGLQLLRGIRREMDPNYDPMA